MTDLKSDFNSHPHTLLIEAYNLTIGKKQGHTVSYKVLSIIQRAARPCQKRKAESDIFIARSRIKISKRAQSFLMAEYGLLNMIIQYPSSKQLAEDNYDDDSAQQGQV